MGVFLSSQSNLLMTGRPPPVGSLDGQLIVLSETQIRQFRQALPTNISILPAHAHERQPRKLLISLAEHACRCARRVFCVVTNPSESVETVAIDKLNTMALQPLM